MIRDGWRPYVPVAQRRQRASKKIAKLRKSGRDVAPIEIEGRKIAKTFWGSAWCDNLEAYSDYANRLPRGRTYVRHGSVVNLQIAGGRISALVSGSDFYEVELRIKPLAVRKWKRIRSQCAGQIDSLVELLQGQISHAVMGIVTRAGEGLFPTPREISLSCSCPDWATMCKHVAAVLYGVGARLDHAPEMLFALRGVDPAEMVSDAVGQAARKRKAGRGRVLAADDLSSVFGVDIDTGGADAEEKPKPARRRRPGAGKKAPASTATTTASKKRASRRRPAKEEPPRAWLAVASETGSVSAWVRPDEFSAPVERWVSLSRLRTFRLAGLKTCD
jgi:uncharacterized Zn finger protein